MAQYSVFGPRTFGSPSVDDFLSPQSGEEGSNFEADYTMDSSADSAVTRGGRTGSIMQKPTVSPAKSNANQRILDGAVEEERVRDASLLILPLLLANPPMLPSHLKSAEVRQRHQMLSISPNDVDDYLVTSFPSAPEDLKSEVIAGLDQLKNSVEQLAGILATDTDAMEHIVRKVRWASPEPGNIQANIFLGDDAADTDAQDGGGGGALCLILKHEEDTGGGRRANREPWRFHNLLPFGGAPGAWFDDLARAQKRPAPAPPAKPAGLSVQWKDRSIDSNGRSRSLTSNATTRTAGSYNTADEGETDQENVAGDAPEDKFTSADDFWGGWDDGEGGEKEESREVINKGAGAEDDEDDEEAYWASYDASDPHADRLRRDAEEAERQKMADLDNVSQMGSVNFDGLERRMDHNDFYAVGAGSTLGADEPIQEEADDGQEEQSHTGDAQMASDSPRRSIDEVPPPLDSGSLPSVAYESVQKMIDAEQQQQQDTQDSTQERSGALSPRSDATSMGLTDEGEQITADNTTVDIDELDRAREAAGKPEPQDDDHRDEMQQQHQDVEPAEKEVTAEEQEERKAEDDVGVAEPMGTPQTEAPPSPTRDPAAATPMPHSPRKARNKMIGIEHLAVAQSRQRKKSGTSHGDVYPPAPMSVSAQSVFETPSDMSLADLEAFYRNRDHQRMVEAKERLSRMHRESRESMRDSTGPPHKHRSERSKASRDDAGDDDDDEEEHDSDIVSEAESALEAVMSEYASAPSRPGTTQAHSDLHEDADEQEQEQEEGQSEKDDDDDAADKQRARSSSNVAQTSAATQSAATRSDADPLEALSQADPMLAFNAEDSNVGEDEGEEDEEAKRKRNRGRVPMTREVSMGTLRRLAEENELKSEEAKRARGDTEDASSTTTGLSKAGGFKNFLQLAPSTVATDLDSEEPILDEDYAEPHALPAAIDEEEEGVLSEEADERHDQEQENDMSEQAAEAAQVPVPASTLGDVDNQRLAAPGLDDRQPGDDDEDHGGAENAASAALSAFAADPNATPRPRDSGGWGKEANKRDENEGVDDREQEEEEGGGNQDEYDLDAFMFPDQHKKNRLDSPGLSDNDPLAREAFGIITGRGGGGGSGAEGRLSPSNFRVPNNRASTSGGAAPSDSFLPGAASDASVRPLLGSIAGRGRSDESGNTGVTGNTGISRALHARGVLDPRRIVEEGNEDEGEGQEEESQGQEDGANEQQPQEPQDEEGEQSFDSQATPRAQHQPPRVNRGGAIRSSKAGESGARSPTSNMATQGNSSANATTSRPSRRATSRNASTDRVLGAASTSTDLGLAEIADDRQSEKYSVAPGPHWIGAAPPPGSTSQHTANLRHQYLRAQRQQALESQRERMGQKPGRAASGDDDEEAPLARGAQQRQPFPPADRGRGGPRGRGGRGRGVRGPPPTRRSPSTGPVKRVKEINGIPASAAVAVGPTDEDEAEDEQQREKEEEEEEEANAARALYDQVKDLARDGDGIDDDEEEDENRDGEDQDDMDEDGDVGGQDELADQDRGQDQQEDQGDEQGGESDEGEENEDGLDAEQRDINGDAGPPSPALRHKSSAHSFSRHSDPQGRPPLPSPAALAPPSPGTPSTSLDPSRAPFNRPNLNQRQQPDRLHASQAAQRRRRALKALQRRNGHVQALLRSVVAVINDQGAEDDLEAGGSAGVLPMMGESDFLRLAREAFRECERMKDERIANGAGGRGGEVGLSGRDVMGEKAKGVVMGGQAAMDDDGQDDEEYETEMPLAMGEEEDNGDEYDDQEEGEEEGDEAAGGAMPPQDIMAL